MGEGVCGREQDAVELAEQDASAHAGRGCIRVEEAARDVAGLERGELRGRGGLGEFEADAGMEAVKLANNGRQHGGHSEAGESDAHVADLAASEGPEVGGNGRDRAEDGFEAFEEKPAGRGELDAAARAIEQIGVERRLQLGDGPAQGGLGDGEDLSGLAEMELAGDLAEVNEVAQFKRELILARHHRGLNKYLPVMARIW